MTAPGIERPHRVVVVDPDGRLFTAVFELGEAHKRTVGMLTKEAWRDYASGGGLIAAVTGDQPEPELLGYAAFRVGAARA